MKNSSMISPPSQIELNNMISIETNLNENDDNQLNNNIIIDDNDEENQINSQIEVNRLLYFLIKIHNILSETSYYLFHTLILSIFEIFFYWLYIANQEREAIVQKAKSAARLIEPLCISFNFLDNDAYNESFENIVNNIKNKNDENNINTSLKPGIIISIIILLIYIFFQFLLYFINSRVKNIEEKKTIRRYNKQLLDHILKSIFCMMFVGFYEIIFFILVVKNYNPIDTSELVFIIIKQCLYIKNG